MATVTVFVSWNGWKWKIFETFTKYGFQSPINIGWS